MKYRSNLFQRKIFCCSLVEDAEFKLNIQCYSILFHSILFPCCTKLFDDEPFDGTTDDLHMADGMTNMFISLRESYPPRPRSLLWPVMFLISHIENPDEFNVSIVVFLAEWFVIFSFLHNSFMQSYFSFDLTLYLLC